MSAKGISDKQLAFVSKLLGDRLKLLGLESVAQALTVTDAANMTSSQARELIDRLLKSPTDPDPDMPEMVAQSARKGKNTRPGKCFTCSNLVTEGQGYYFLDGMQRWAVIHRTGDCTTAPATSTEVGIDLSHVPSGLYADPAGDTRLKVAINKPVSGKWAGWTFVQDGAVYGFDGRLGKAGPGETYVGKSMDVLARIAADPVAALKAYADITGKCGICRKALEDTLSVEMGIGPVCSAKNGFDAQRQAIHARLVSEGKL